MQSEDQQKVAGTTLQRSSPTAAHSYGQANQIKNDPIFAKTESDRSLKIDIAAKSDGNADELKNYHKHESNQLLVGNSTGTPNQ